MYLNFSLQDLLDIIRILFGDIKYVEDIEDSKCIEYREGDKPSLMASASGYPDSVSLPEESP